MFESIVPNIFAALSLFFSPVQAEQSQEVSSYPTPIPIQTEEIVEDNLIWVVKKDETLQSVAQGFYGDRSYWTSLWNDNAWLDDPENVPEGTVLRLRSDAQTAPEALKEELSAKLVKPTSPPSPTLTPVTGSFRPSNFDAVYQEAGAKYSIPWQILYGLHLTETGLRDGAISNYTGSGAQGPMQFMPGTWRAYGVDGNGDGIADINNAVDAIHGAANYLAKHGSLENGLRHYGGNYSGTLKAACSRGFCL